MSAAGAGAIAGATLGGITSMLSLKAANKQAIGSINAQGEALRLQGSNLISNLKIIQYNRDELDRELGDVLSKDALATAKNMATAKVIMSTRGTVGGTSALASKQVYIDQIQADADAINQAKKSDVNMLMSQLQKQIEFKTQQRQAQMNMDATRSSIQSPFGALIGTASAMIGGASAGATMGQGVQGMMSTSSASAGQSFTPSMASESRSWVHQTPRSQW